MIDRLKEKIKERFPHIKFDSDDGFKFWFFETYLPFLILIEMGLAEEQEETKCVGFDVRDTVDKGLNNRLVYQQRFE